MKIHLPAVLLALSLVTVLFSQGHAQGASQQKWEYKVASIQYTVMSNSEKTRAAMETALNELGAQGWLLTATGTGPNGVMLLYLRR